ncbi:MAG: hypothetical protein GY711_07360 [bacterium]|nr:hypothetical protein [bacterium]
MKNLVALTCVVLVCLVVWGLGGDGADAADPLARAAEPGAPAKAAAESAPENTAVAPDTEQPAPPTGNLVLTLLENGEPTRSIVRAVGWVLDHNKGSDAPRARVPSTYFEDCVLHPHPVRTGRSGSSQRDRGSITTWF